MRKRSAPKGEQRGTPVGRSFLQDNLSPANKVEYNRQTIMGQAIKEIGECGPMCQSDYAGYGTAMGAYKRKKLYGGVSNYRRDEIFTDEQKP